MSRVREFAHNSGHLLRGVVQDFRAWPERGPRTIDEIESVLSVLLAIAFAHLLGARNIGWAAFGGYMVMRSHFAESLARGARRVMGTAVGAACAWLLASHILRTPALLSLALMLVGATTLYLALVSRHGYAWFFAGLTFSMVLIDGMEHPAEGFDTFARTRLIEVFTGTLAAVLVSALSSITIRRQWPGRHYEPSPQPLVRKPLFWHRTAFLHALQGATALALIPWVWTWFGIHALSQAGITIIAVMMVPLASLSNPLRPTRSRLVHRVVGCTVGALVGTAVLLASYQAPLTMIVAMCVGIAAGRHVENGRSGIGYVGTQFVLAFLVVLVPDTYSAIDPRPGFDRLVGIILGVVLLEPVRLVLHAAQRSRPWRIKA
jgi:uncharacterized membrane protein YccC